MKQFFTLFFTLITVLTANLLNGQNLTFKPANPIPGEKIQISYNPIGTDLQRVEKIEAICYEFSEDGPVASEVYLQIKDNAYSGVFQVSKDAKVVFISLSADDKKDNNSGNGFSTVIYKKDRKTPQPGAFASLASVYGNYYRTVGLERDNEKALLYLEKEYSQYPEAKKDGKYLGSYSFYAAKTKNEKVLAECAELVKSLRMQVNDEEDLMTISSIYSNIGDDEAAKAVDAKIVEEYPEGERAQKELVNTFYKTKKLDEKLEIYSEIQLKFGDKETAPPPMDRINSNVALEYGQMEDWRKFNTFFMLIKDPTAKASLLNSLAWPLSGESIDDTPKNAAKGRELSGQSLDLIKSEMEAGASKPASMTKNQWKKQLEYSYGMYADTYALCSYQEGDYKDALKYQRIACEASDFKNGGIAELYCVYLEKINGSKAVESELQSLIARGVATDKMKEQYQRIYLENNTLETALEKNMAFLQSIADEKKMEDLKGKMIMEKAPDFSLVNLKGEKVALGDLKGKVVVLDFWATWCGPCKASFPGMQTAVDKYKNNDDVVFLFLDTWEKEGNKEENAQNFMTEKGYTFNVLMDNENEIVTKFNVSGIPTKFIVDKNGNIRFKSVGFSGNNADLVSELSMMIDMANEASTNGKTIP